MGNEHSKTTAIICMRSASHSHMAPGAAQKTKLEICLRKISKAPGKSLLSVASHSFFTADFMHIALATRLLGLLLCAGFAFFHSFLQLQRYFYTSEASEWEKQTKSEGEDDVPLSPHGCLWSPPHLTLIPFQGLWFLQLPAVPMLRQTRLQHLCGAQ